VPFAPLGAPGADGAGRPTPVAVPNGAKLPLPFPFPLLAGAPPSRGMRDAVAAAPVKPLPGPLLGAPLLGAPLLGDWAAGPLGRVAVAP